MPDPTRGLYGKYLVKRVDGTDEPGGKHHGCDLFVLDLTHDPLARGPALAYAENARAAGYVQLAADLTDLVHLYERRQEKSR